MNDANEIPEHLKPFVKAMTDKGAYISINDDEYTDAAQLIHSAILQFCCCSNLEMNLRYIRDGLALIEDLHKPGGDNAHREDVYKRSIEHHGGEAPQQFFQYWCDEKGYTEHGGAIPGWLDGDGIDLLKALENIDLEDD